MKELAPKRQRFIDEYLIDLNATRAYIAAGYSPKGAGESAAKLLKNTLIREEIRKRQEEIGKKAEVTAERLTAELANIAFFDIGSIHNSDGSVKHMNEWPADARAAVNGFEVAEMFDGAGEQKHAFGLIKKVKTSDKLRAIELLTRRTGGFVDRHELTGRDGQPLEQNTVLNVVFIDAEDGKPV